jgi:hypothetical protein
MSLAASFGGGGDGGKEEDEDNSTVNTEVDSASLEEKVELAKSESKFMSMVVNPLDNPKVVNASSMLMFEQLDKNGDGQIFGDEILTNEMEGFDVNDDDVLSMDELKKYIKGKSNPQTS